MHSVSQAYLDMLADTIQDIVVWVELLETSGFNWPEDVTMTWTASSFLASAQSSFHEFDVANLGDGISAEPVTYLVWGCGKTFGDRCVFSGPDMKHNMGWWSAASEMSNASKVFTTQPWVQVVYSAAIEANFIWVSTSQSYSGIKTANVKVWYDGDGDWTDLGTITFTEAGAATDYRRAIQLAEGAATKQVLKVKVTCLTSKTASDFARLLEVVPTLERSRETLSSIEGYVTEEGLSLKKSSGEMIAEEPASPGVGVNELSMTIQYDAPFVPKRGQLLKVYAGFDASEMLDQGVYLISNVEDDPDGYYVTAHGFLDQGQRYPYPSTVHNMHTVTQIVQELLNWMGFRDNDIVLDVTEDNVWSWYVTQDKDCDAALADMAENFSLAIFETDDGKVKVIDNYAASVFTLTDIYIHDYRKASPVQKNYVAVHYGKMELAAWQQVVSASIDLIASEEKTVGLALSRAPVYLHDSPILALADDEDVTLEWWSADAYWLNVRLKNNLGTAASPSVSMNGYPLSLPENELIAEAEDSALIHRNGFDGYDAQLYTDSTTRAQALADALLKYMKGASGTVILTLNRPAFHFELRDVVTISSALRPELDGDYVIIAMSDVFADQPELELLPKAAVV